MILLLGGTSETCEIASALATAGLDVLVSTATDEPLDVGCRPRIHRRSGRLDERAIYDLVLGRGIRAVVDATHPYAAQAHAAAAGAACRAGIPCVRFARPGGVEEAPDIHFAADHEQAAAAAFSFGRAVLLTTGSNNLAPYVAQSRRTSMRLVVRVLPSEQSIRTCRQAGLADAAIIAMRGPFSVEQNLLHLREHDIGVLVTKDSGQAGGVAEKLHAARTQHCQVVIVARPPAPTGQVATTVPAMVEMLQGLL
jgi:precorrin-6A/cobalt-precorrin-6A reductase